MLKETILINDVYSLEDDLFPFIPWNANKLYSVTIDRYGFLHDVGINIRLVPSCNPTGWNTLRKDFALALADVKQCWKMNSEFGYH